MKKFDVSIEDENVVLRSSAGEVESIRINGGASFNLVRDNKLVLKIESPVVGANGLPIDHGRSDSQYEKDTDTVPYERKEIPSFASLATGDTLVTPYTPATWYMYNSVNIAGCEDSQFARLTEKWVRKHLKRKKKAAKKQEPVVLSSGDALHVSVTTVNGKATGFSQSVERGEGEGKSEPQKICGACRYAPENIFDFMLCEKRERSVPDSFDSCPDFEPRTSEKSALERLSAVIKSGAEAAEASSKIAAEYLSGVTFSTRLAGDKDATERIAQLEKENVELENKLNRMTEACEKGSCGIDYHRSENARLRKVVSSLKKENAELQKTNAHLRKELVWQFEQLSKKIELVVKRNDRFNEKNRQACDRINDLETQNAQLQEKLTAAIEEVKSKDFLSEQLAQAAQRIRDLEREASKRNWPPRIRFYL